MKDEGRAVKWEVRKGKFLSLAFFIAAMACVSILATAAGPRAGTTEAIAGSWELSWIKPWWNRDAAWLQAHVAEVRLPSKDLALEGMGNDWVVAACVLRSSRAVDVSVKLEGKTGFVEACDLKVAGHATGPERDGYQTWWLDPLFANPSQLGDRSSYIHNWAAICDFPTLHLQPGDPAVLWLTIRTHGLDPGPWEGQIVACDTSEGRRELRFELQIHPVVLPVDNPIVGHAWIPCWGSRDIAKTVKDYGFNVAGYGDWDMQHELGYRYHRFVLPGRGRNIGGGTPDTVTDEQLLAALKPIRDTVERLHLGPDQWGLEIYDEPLDRTAKEVAAWMARIRQAWPEVRFWANPGWGPSDEMSMTVAGTVDVLAPFADVWCPYFEGFIRGGTLDAMKATGKPVWYYWITQVWRRQSTGGRNTPWIAWKYDLQGWGFYALLNTQGNVDPWRDNVYQHMYPNNTVTLWMEGLRQGVQDYKRLFLLTQRGTPRDALKPLVDAVLARGREAPWSEAPPEICAKVRKQLDEMVVAHAEGEVKAAESAVRPDRVQEIQAETEKPGTGRWSSASPTAQ